MIHPIVSVIFLCGGQGTRMKTSIPKQFLQINHKMIASYSLDVFKSMTEIAEIVVVCDPQYRHHFPLDHCPMPIRFASPGIRRQDSVFNGLHALEKDIPLVCIHDGARPFIDVPLVQRVIHAADVHGAATAGMPLNFTFKEHDGSFFVKKTPDRSKYWEIQTPQIMRSEWIWKGFEYVNSHELEVTDDVSLIEHLGHPVKLVEGSYRNIKITTADDLTLAEYLLNKQ